MYEIYQTEGIILRQADFGEANKYLFVFTKEFGLIKIAAQGLRNIKSKLRCGLQEFSISQLSLVQGKMVWRITNVDYGSSLYLPLVEDKDKLIVMKSVMDLLTQLLSGQEKNEELYNAVKIAFSFLRDTNLNSDEIKSFESILVLRILYCLGYFDKDKWIASGFPYSTFFVLDEWNSDLFVHLGKNRRKIISDINMSLQSSQLI